MNKKEKISKADLNENVSGNPETAEQLINKYGTYNIQPTADTENDYPQIAQGLAKTRKNERRIKNR